jgi:hypothetical protein
MPSEHSMETHSSYIGEPYLIRSEKYFIEGSNIDVKFKIHKHLSDKIYLHDYLLVVKRYERPCLRNISNAEHGQEDY